MKNQEDVAPEEDGAIYKEKGNNDPGRQDKTKLMSASGGGPMCVMRRAA